MIRFCRVPAIFQPSHRISSVSSTFRSIQSWHTLAQAQFAIASQFSINFRPPLRCPRIQYRHISSSKRAEGRGNGISLLGFDADRFSNAAIIDAYGKVEHKKITWRELKRISRLPARDLLRLEERQDIPQFHILPRNRCILISLSQLRALIFHDRIILFNLEGKHVASIMKKLKSDIEQYLHQKRAMTAQEMNQEELYQEFEIEDPSSLPFEFLVLDTCIRETAARYAQRVLLMRPLIHKTLRKFGGFEGTSEANSRLITLFPLRNTLQHFVTVNSNLLASIKDILDDERDMREACLTDKVNRSIATISPGPPESLLVLETLLEAHHQRISETFQSADELSRNVRLKQDTINLQMDAYRNYIMSRSLDIEVAALGLAVATFAVGAFGMNLHSGLEQVPGLLWPVTASSGILAAIFGVRYIAQVRAGSPFSRYMTQIQEFKNKLNSDSENSSTKMMHLLGWSAVDTDITITPQQFQKLYAAAIGREVSEAELRLMFDTFDSNADGLLDVEEAIGLLENGDTMHTTTPHESRAAIDEGLENVRRAEQGTSK